MRICSDFVYCAKFVQIVELCAKCVKSSNFRTQKEQNKKQGHVRFFCANILFVLKEQNRTTMSRTTSMRRGTQGHVAEPRGPTRAPAWHGCDTCVYIYLLVI